MLGLRRYHVHMQGSEQSRWQYVILWRYGALGLAVVGLAMLGCGASGLRGTPISLSLMTFGFACLITGVILPRIEGKFTAGTSGVTAELLAVHQLDSLTYVASAPAVASPQRKALVSGENLTVDMEIPEPQPIKLGDVWDALEAAGFRHIPGSNGMNKAALVGPEGRAIALHVRHALGWAVASADLLTQLESWGIHPTPSSAYPFPVTVNAEKAKLDPYSAVRIFTHEPS